MVKIKKPYNYRSERVHAMKKIKLSFANRLKKGWTMPEGAGFIVSDIIDIGVNPDGSLHYVFTWGAQDIFVNELNLREQEESLMWFKKHKIGETNK